MRTKHFTELNIPFMEMVLTFYGDELPLGVSSQIVGAFLNFVGVFFKKVGAISENVGVFSEQCTTYYGNVSIRATMAVLATISAPAAQ